MSDKFAFDGIKFDSEKEVASYKKLMSKISVVAANDHDENLPVDDYELEVYVSVCDTTQIFQEHLNDINFSKYDDCYEELAFG